MLMLVYYGTFLEFFEFVLFALLFPVLGKTLSTTFTIEQQASLQYGLFWIGFLGRPLGAFVLSPLGDNVSRKKILVISVAGMAFSTMFLGCTPFTINPWITVIYIAIFRLLQGVFTGVEYAAATIYTYESHTSKQKKSESVVYLGNMAVFGTAAAYMVGGFCYLDYLNVIHFWRAAFILVGFLGLWTGGLRLMRLSDNFMQHKMQQTPILNALKDKTVIKNMVIAFFLTGMSFGPWYYITTFVNTYGIVLLEKKASLPFFLNAAICLFIGIIIYSIVWMQKKKQPSNLRIKIYYSAFAILLAPASYFIFNSTSKLAYVVPQLMLAISSQLIVVNVIGLAPSLFKPEIRLRTFAVVQTLSSSILGGGRSPYMPLVKHNI
jgi:MHS family proline/betaine transporter-like MFS transporter